MADYVLDTVWWVAAEPEAVWPVLTAVEEWPRWWRGVRAVERLEEGDAAGRGRRYRTTWRGRLPYDLTFETETTRIERPVLIEGRARGQLRGTGTWRLQSDGAATRVHYRWAVRTARLWMNALAPLARPLFVWNHDALMRWGAEGLSRRLNVPARFAADAVGERTTMNDIVSRGDPMTPETARSVALRLIQFLETGEAPPGLFAESVFCDFTLPLWRLQARGREPVLALRRQGHPGPGRVPRWRCDPTPTGFVLEVEERWEQDGEFWYCRELIRADVAGEAIAEIAVYCTGDWDSARQAEHRRAVRLLRP